MTALSAAKFPLTRDERLGKARAAAIRWVEAARDSEAPPGPFWRLLRAYAEDAETLGLNDARLKHYVINGLRYLEFCASRAAARRPPSTVVCSRNTRST